MKRLIVFLFVCSGLLACGEGLFTTSYSSYSLGGTVSGLQGTLQLYNNDSELLPITANGNFAFTQPIASTTLYDVSIFSSPSAQICSIAAGTGTGQVVAADIHSIAVVCVDKSAGGAGIAPGTYAIGGTVTGLLENANVSLLLGTQTLDVDAADPNFFFGVALPTGTAYQVTLASQPPGEACSVISGTGVAGPDLRAVVVQCVPTPYTLSTVVSGLADGDSVVLSSNLGGQLVVTGGGNGQDSASFSAPVNYGSTYVVGIAVQPLYALCSVASPSGVINSNTQVSVTCVPQDLPLLVSVHGLPSGQTTQIHNNENAPITVTGSGTGTDNAVLQQGALYGSGYDVGVVSSPNGYTCSVNAGTGLVTGFNPIVVTVNCAPQSYSVSAYVTGLDPASIVTLGVNTAAPVAIVGDGTGGNGGVIASAVPFGSTYTVSVVSNPNAQLCTVVSGGNGVMPAASITVDVSCVDVHQIFVTANGLVVNGMPITLAVTHGANAQIASMSLSDATNGVALAFPMGITAGTQYSVTVAAAAGYQCAFGGAPASGTMPNADITNISLACSPNLLFAAGQQAAVVLGQLTFSGSAALQGQGVADATNMNNPTGNAYGAPNGTFYVADRSTNRVLGYHRLPVTSGIAADYVLGQPNFNSGSPAVSANTFVAPMTVSGNGNRLLIGDDARLLIYNSLPYAQVNADSVIGQPDFVTDVPNPNGNRNGCTPAQLGRVGTGGAVLTNSNQLLLADPPDSRVLLYQDITQSSASYATVGQGYASNCYYASGASPAAYNLALAESVYLDGNRLFVADTQQHRILIWDNFANVATGTNADHVMGQQNFTSAASGASSTTLWSPHSVVSYNGQLFVADTYNHRILIWNPTPSGPVAAYQTAPSAVLGQSDFNSSACNRGGTPNAGTLCFPTGLAIVGTSLVVTDSANHRVLIYHSM